MQQGGSLTLDFESEVQYLATCHRRPIQRALVGNDGRTVLTASADGMLCGWFPGQHPTPLRLAFACPVVPPPPKGSARHGRLDWLTDIAVMPISNR
jgi:hypothetical protein